MSRPAARFTKTEVKRLIEAARDCGVQVVGVGINSPIAAGEHVLAISVHNVNPDSTDLRLGNVQLYGIR